MIKKILRIFFTIRYLKKQQLFYQLWYRFKFYLVSVDNYKKYLNEKLFSYEIKTADLVFINKKLLDSNLKFNFIGKSFSFGNKVDWNFKEYGKLWNYNLQYLNYINDESIELETRCKLIKDLSIAIVSKKVILESYPVSLRIINLFLFHQKHHIKDKLVIKSLLLQINFLENNLEYHLLGNHLLENIFSLFIAGHFLKNKALIKKSTNLILKELDEQILNDGAHYECSAMYHSVILSKLCLSIEVARQGGYLSPEELIFLNNKASIMFSWLDSYSFPDGSWALFNDSALGMSAGTLELKKCIKLLKINSKLTELNESGFRKLKYIDFELIIKTGEIQPKHQPGHSHSDILSYCLWHKGKQVIVDPGISTYEIGDVRLFERSSINHNTISINSFNQSDMWSSFRVGKRAKSNILQHNDKIIKSSVTNFYHNSNYTHTRTIKIINKSILIIDEVSNLSPNDICYSNIHFDNNLKLILDERNLNINDCFLEFVNGQYDIDIKDYMQSIYFGKKINSKKITFKIKNKSSFRVDFVR